MVKLSYFLSVVFMVFSMKAQAEWRVQSFNGQASPLGLESFGVFEKVRHTKAGDFSTGVITNSVIRVEKLSKLKRQPQTPAAMAEQLREALKTPAWDHQSVNGLEIYSLKWKEERRFLRLIIQKDQKFVRVSFANLRQPYALLESLEADVLQRAFFKIDEKKSKKTAGLWPFLWSQMEPQAEAGLNLSSDQLLSAYRGYLESMDQVAKNMGYNSAREISNALMSSTQSLSSNAVLASQNVAGGINNLADSVRSSFSFMNGMKFGAGMGVGFTVSSALTNFVMDGSAKLVRELYYFALGKMKPEERAALDARVGKAFEQIQVQSDKLNQVQKELTMYEMAFSSAYLLPTGLMIDSEESADRARIDLEAQLKQMKDKLATATGTDRARCVESVRYTEGQLAKVQAMKAVLTEAGGKSGLCRKIGDLLDDWIVAEASLHRASSVVSSEMTTVLGQIQNEEIAALEDPVSKRKKINECEARSKKLAARNRELYQAKNCEAQAGDADCADFKYQIELFEKSVGDCEVQFNRSEEAQSARTLARGAELTNQQIAVAKKRLERIAAADCKAGETSGACKGEVGDLEQLRQVYQSKAETYRKTCPQSIPEAPVVNFSKDSYQSGFVADNDLKVQPPARAPQSVSKPQSGGFLDGIFGFFKRLFGGS